MKVVLIQMISGNIACCQFYLGMYNESKISANKPNKKSQLLNRLMFHLCHKFGDENELKQYHQQFWS
jgi:hypothetical protein